jgi:soluble lytic murein transglycosylase
MTIPRFSALVILVRSFRLTAAIAAAVWLHGVPSAASAASPAQATAKKPAASRTKAASKATAASAPAKKPPASQPKAARAATASAAKPAVRATSPLHARLAAGIEAYNANRMADAALALEGLAGRLAKVDDYVLFHLGAARLHLGDPSAARPLLHRVVTGKPESPFLAQAILLEAKALTDLGDPREALHLLESRQASVPPASLALAQAKAWEALGENQQAVAAYQRVYYGFPLTEQASRAAEALATLRRAMGASFPEPGPAELLERAGKLWDGREYARARDEYIQIQPRLTAAGRELAILRSAAALYYLQQVPAAERELRRLRMETPEVEAERLHYLYLCAARQGQDAEAERLLDLLARDYPSSPWRLQSLLAFQGRHLLRDETGVYGPRYQACAESFPDAPEAANCHWRVAWLAYRRRDASAAARLREHAVRYPGSPKASAALYFFARLEEQAGRKGTARAVYEYVESRYPHYYYGLLSRDRLEDAELAKARPDPLAREWLSRLPAPRRPPVDVRTTPATETRIVRSRILREAGLKDLAVLELRVGARTDAAPAVVALELARQADTPAQGLRFMKSLISDYFGRNLEELPEQFWRHLFPLPYRTELWKHAASQDLDPYLVAGLIRQESEFDPQARSRANARGLTQVLPATGRELARRAGIPKFHTQMLHQPEISLRLGTLMLRSMLNSWDGKWEETLASYNAGRSRVVTWLAWGDFQEPAEFVETIPFTETREYVQAVIRNARLYRRIYASSQAARAGGADSRPATP